MAATAADLQTVVRNVSGQSRYFGYLNSHGKELAAGETLAIDGDLLALLSHPRKKRQRTAYLNDLTAGRLALVRTPSPHYYDETLDDTKVLEVANGSVIVANPSWGAYSSSIDA